MSCSSDDIVFTPRDVGKAVAFSFFDLDVDTQGCEPENVTGYGFELRIVRSDCLVATVTGTILDPTNGEVAFIIDPSAHLSKGRNLASFIVTDTNAPTPNEIEYLACDEDKLRLYLED